MRSGKLNIVVGIATSGRPRVLSTTIDLLAQQTRRPDRLVLCPATVQDIDAALLESFPVPTVVVESGTKGLTAQRNKILSVTENADVIVFFDDDFFPRTDYLEQVESMFLQQADVVAATGRPLKDGAQGPGLSVEDGLAIVSAPSGSCSDNKTLTPTYGTYGCNMAFRLDPIRKNRILFDENLPLYGWQEDIDFSRALSSYGRIVESELLRGVHLGAKQGRTSGVRFGYSQIANPIYLIRKGTMSPSFARTLMLRNLATNLFRSFWSEPWIDRKGRLRGNVLALIDVATRRISPGRILSLD